MARHKKRKARKNSNYQVRQPGSQSATGKAKGEKRKFFGTVYLLFALFAVISLFYFAYNMITGNGDFTENAIAYLLPAAVCGCVSVVAFIKKV